PERVMPKRSAEIARDVVVRDNRLEQRGHSGVRTGVAGEPLVARVRGVVVARITVPTRTGNDVDRGAAGLRVSQGPRHLHVDFLRRGDVGGEPTGLTDDRQARAGVDDLPIHHDAALRHYSVAASEWIDAGHQETLSGVAHVEARQPGITEHPNAA